MGIKRWYGLIGLLSLLGFVGVFTGERFPGLFCLRGGLSVFFLPGLMRCRRARFSARPHGAFSRAWE